MALGYYSTSRPTQLVTAMSNVDTAVIVADGATYPDPAVSGKEYTVIIGYGSDREEICTVTAKPNATTLTVIRAQDGTAATAKNIGDTVVHGVSARDFKRVEEVESDLAAAEAAIAALQGGKYDKTGGPVSGPITLPGNAAGGLQAVPLQQVQAAMAAAVPVGTVIMFGSATIPPEMAPYWHLCDGTAHGSTALQAVIGSANAPDLRGRFVVGVGTGYAAGATGGAEQVTLTADQSGERGHGHTASVSGHTHGVPGQTVNSGGMSANNPHLHGAPAGFDFALNPDAHTKTAAAGTAVAGIAHWQTTTNNTDIQHSHSVTVAPVTSDGASPAQTVTVAAAPAAPATAAHENRPPYYALTYLIKKA